MYLLTLLMTWASPVHAKEPACVNDAFDGELLFAESVWDLDHGNASSSFDIHRIRSLVVRLETSTPLDTVEIEALVFITPNGLRLYESQSVFSADPALTQVTSNEYVNDLPVRPMTELADGDMALDQLIPIAGTVFQRPSRLGIWEVEATLRGRKGTVFGTFEFLGR